MRLKHFFYFLNKVLLLKLTLKNGLTYNNILYNQNMTFAELTMLFAGFIMSKVLILIMKKGILSKKDGKALSLRA